MYANGKSGLRREGQLVNIAEVGEMKKGYIVTAVFAIVAFAVEAGATDEDLYKAWAGATNVNPVTFTPQQLGAADEFDNDSPLYNMTRMTTNNDVWANWDDNGWPEKDYNFMMFRFNPVDWPQIICYWEVRADGGPCIQLFAWDNDEEDWTPSAIDVNSGGQNPGNRSVDVSAYVYDYITLLAIGDTDGAGEDRISCDQCRLKNQ